MLNQKVPNAVKDTLSKNKVDTQQMLTSACAHLGEYTYNAHVNHTYTIIKQSIRCPRRMLRARRAGVILNRGLLCHLSFLTQFCILQNHLWISTKLSIGFGRWLSGRERIQHEGLDFNPQHNKQQQKENNNKTIFFGHK